MHLLRKRFFSLLLCACFILTFAPASVFAADAEAEYTTQEGNVLKGSLAEAIENAANEGSITLLEDVTVTRALLFTDKSVTLLGNGNTITLENSAYIALKGNAQLRLGDKTKPKESVLTICSTDTLLPLITLNDQSRLDMADGVTLGPSVAVSTPAGVALQDESVFNMYGGLITSCVNEYSLTGGVYVEDYSQFHMYGGVIENCVGVQGGAVGLSGGNVIGIMPDSAALFHMHGGTIRNCSDAWYGGGAVCIYTVNPVKFIMDGGTITSCKAVGDGYGGAVFVFSRNQNVVKLNGGEIVENSAKYGGGVFVYAGEVLFGSQMKIYDNTATQAGDDLYINSVAYPVTLESDNSGTVLSGCGHAVDGWYEDDSSARWSCAASASAAKYAVPEDFVLDEPIALKAAHGAIYAISVTPQEIDFGTKEEGYFPLDAQTVSVTNTGNQTITLTQPSDENYEIGELSALVLAPNETATFTVRPKDGLPQGSYTQSIFIAGNHDLHEKVDAAFTVSKPQVITLAPVAMTVYMGGTDGYDAAVTAQGEIASTSSLPVPGFTIQLPGTLETALAAAGEDITDLRFVSGNRQWKAVSYDGISGSIYKLVPCGFDGQEPVGVAFDNGERFVTSDQFAVGEHVNQNLEMRIYSGDAGDFAEAVTVSYGGSAYTVDFSAAATLAVRGTTEKVKTAAVVGAEDLVLTRNEPAAAAADGMIYRINEKDLQADASGIALLFDDIIEERGSTARTDLLKAKADEALDALGANSKRHYVFKYLDLVDTMNGNAWVTAADAQGEGRTITVYWPLPQGTTRRTNFTLLHFKGLDRDMAPDRIESSIENCRVEKIAVSRVTDTHVVFEIGADGFSPFALIWESNTFADDNHWGWTTKHTLSYESNGGTPYDDERYASGTTVNLDKVPVREGYTFTGWYADAALTIPITDIYMNANKTVYAGWKISGVPEWLNGDEHFAYIVGYPDGTIGAKKEITRAEVASIFFRLLTDEVRTAYLTEENRFADVDADDWFNTEVSTLEALGILEGRTNDEFMPNAPITRAEFAAICARFGGDHITGDSNLTDIAGHWAEAEIERAVVQGWVAGYLDATFRPDSCITRAEAVAMINRVLHRLPEDESDLLEERTVWPDCASQEWYYLALEEAGNTHAFERKADGVHEYWTKRMEDPDWSQY